jgi:hypothetical protein
VKGVSSGPDRCACTPRSTSSTMRASERRGRNVRSHLMHRARRRVARASALSCSNVRTQLASRTGPRSQHSSSGRNPLHLPPPTPPALAASRRAPAFCGARSGAAGVDRVGRSGAVKRAQREPRDERESASARRGARATVGDAAPRVGVSSPKGSRRGRQNGSRRQLAQVASAQGGNTVPACRRQQSEGFAQGASERRPPSARAGGFGAGGNTVPRVGVSSPKGSRRGRQNGGRRQLAQVASAQGDNTFLRVGVRSPKGSRGCARTAHGVSLRRQLRLRKTTLRIRLRGAT